MKPLIKVSTVSICSGLPEPPYLLVSRQWLPSWYCKNVEVKFTLEQAKKPQRGFRHIALLFH